MSDAPTFAGLSSTTPRKVPARAVVIHTTGGVRPPRGVFETLRARGLSVHYIVGSDGEVLQTAPTSLVCRHAGKVNAWSIGIECVSPHFPTTRAAEIERARGVHRRVYRDRVKGKRLVTMLDLTEPQMAATVQLVEQLCDTLAIPRQVPVDGDGELLRREMTDAELARFAGVMGHYHSHASKTDPGTTVLDELRRRWTGGGLDVA